MTANPPKKKKFLVIRLGGLEEMLLSTGAFKAIREKMKDHSLTLLTGAPYVDMMKGCGSFDEVVADPIFDMLTEPIRYFSFLNVIRKARFNGVFDLEGSRRTEWYFRCMGRVKPDWSGPIEWCSHPYINPLRREMHLLDVLEEQLASANIRNVPRPDIGWLKGDIGKFQLPKEYALLFPGGKDYVFTRKSADGEQEVRLPPRWRGQGFAEVATWLVTRGITPVFLGSDDETAVVAEAVQLCGGLPVLNLVNKVGLVDIAEMARGAKIAIGNDNEGMWPAALTGCPSILIFPSQVRYRQRVPRGPQVRVLEQADLDMLPPKEVIRTAGELMALDMAAETAKKEPG